MMSMGSRDDERMTIMEMGSCRHYCCCGGSDDVRNEILAAWLVSHKVHSYMVIRLLSHLSIASTRLDFRECVILRQVSPSLMYSRCVSCIDDMTISKGRLLTTSPYSIRLLKV